MKDTISNKSDRFRPLYKSPWAAQENFLLSNQFLLDNAAPSVRLSLKIPAEKRVNN